MPISEVHTSHHLLINIADFQVPIFYWASSSLYFSNDQNDFQYSFYSIQ